MRRRGWFAKCGLFLSGFLAFGVLSPVAAQASPPTSLEVDFGSATSKAPAGYVLDYGAAFDPATGMGWKNNSTGTPMSIVGNGRQRNANADPLLDSLIHMQAPAGVGNSTPAKWTATLANGSYAVTVGIGDPSYVDSVDVLSANGGRIANFKPTNTQRQLVVTATVRVVNGTLTLDPSGGTNTKIDYVRAVPANPPLTASSDSVTYLQNAQHTSIDAASKLSPALKSKWSKTFPGVLWYPLIIGERVYVVSQNSLYALDKTTGATVWGPVANFGNSTTYGPKAAITYDAGKIFVTETGLVNSGYHGVKAFDAATGRLLWSQSQPSSTAFPRSTNWDNPPVAANGVLYVTGSNGYSTLYAISQATGATLWTVDYPSGNGSTPALLNGDVFFWYGNGAAGRVSSAGSFSWINRSYGSGGTVASPVLSNGTLWGASDGVNQMIDAASGKITGTFNSQSTFVPVITPNVRLFSRLAPSPEGTTYNVLTAVSPSGATIWTLGGQHLTTQPVVANGVVYVSAESGATWGLDLNTGKALWTTNVGTFDVPGQFLNSAAAPATAGGVLAIPVGKTLKVFGN